jgi:hypothetical protein
LYHQKEEGSTIKTSITVLYAQKGKVVPVLN